MRTHTAFAEHPVFKDLEKDRALTRFAGLGNPYHRRHDGRAGARTVLQGRQLLNFTSYDYLGLNRHPEVLAAHQQAAERYGTSVSGTTASAKAFLSAASAIILLRRFARSARDSRQTLSV